MSYNRYKQMTTTNNIKSFPFIKLDINEKDKYEIFFINQKKTRLDVLADKYYNDSTLWFLILMANPQYKNEIEIPDNTVLRIPFPKERILQELDEKIKFFNEI